MPTWRRGIYGSEGAAIEDHGLEFESVGEFCEQRGFDFLLKFHPSEGVKRTTMTRYIPCRST